MNEILWLLASLRCAIFEAARRRAGSKKVRAHLHLALARINEVFHSLST
jgi:hypothetical protein